MLFHSLMLNRCALRDCHDPRSSSCTQSQYTQTHDSRHSCVLVMDSHSGTLRLPFHAARLLSALMMLPPPSMPTSSSLMHDAARCGDDSWMLAGVGCRVCFQSPLVVVRELCSLGQQRTATPDLKSSSCSTLRNVPQSRGRGREAMREAEGTVVRTTNHTNGRAFGFARPTDGADRGNRKKQRISLKSSQ
jgi:hypothetical protein